MIPWILEQPGWDQVLEGPSSCLCGWMAHPDGVLPSPLPIISWHKFSLLELRCIPREQGGGWGGGYELLEIKFSFLKVKDFIRTIYFSHGKK